MHQDKENIVIYKGISKYDSTRFFSDELIDAFRKLGYNVIEIDLDNLEDVNNKINYINGIQIKASFGFNGVGADITLVDGTYLQNILKSNFYVFFLDNPIYVQNRINTPIKNYYGIVVDEEHKTIIDKYNPNIVATNRIFHGGSVNEIFEKTKSIEKYQNRKYDVVFLGSYSASKEIIKQIEKLQDEYKIIVYEVINRMLENMDETVFTAFNSYLLENNINLQDNEYLKYYEQLYLADKFVRNYIRELIIKVIINNHIKIHVFGSGWDTFQNGNNNLIIHNQINYKESLEILANCKISLNIMPEFKNGTHERVFNSMLAGAVSLTDKTSLLSGEFENEKDIEFYELNEISKLPVIIKNLLMNIKKAEEIALCGYKKAKAKYTWENVALNLINIIEKNNNQQLYNNIISEFMLYEDKRENILKYNRCQNLLDKLKILLNEKSTSEGYGILQYLESKLSTNTYALAAIYSFGMQYYNSLLYTYKILSLAFKDKVDWEIKLSIYWHIIGYSFTYKISSKNDLMLEKNNTDNIENLHKEEMLWRLYTNIVDEIKKQVNYNLSYIENRNKDKIVVITSQFLSMEHGPTKTVLDRCECLMNKLNKEVVIINSAEIMYFNKKMCLYNVLMGTYNDKLIDKETIEYNGLTIPYIQYSNKMPNVVEIRKAIDKILEINPYFILNIGGNSILTDILSDGIPTLTISTVPSSLTVTMGQFQAIGRKLNERDINILKKRNKTVNHVIEGVFTSSFKEQTKFISRKDLGLPEDKFIIILIGGRLTSEITDEFLENLLSLCENNIVIALAGTFDKYLECKKKYTDFSKKVYNLGFQDDIMAVLDCCDLYVNPIRTGGGTSAAEAMWKGIPVVTFPVGDVGLGASEQFYVNNYDEMKKTIIKYSKDKKFYEEMSLKAKDRASELTDTSKEFGKIISEVIKRIEKERV